MLQEVIEIQKHFNREDGWRVPSAWDPVLHCVKSQAQPSSIAQPVKHQLMASLRLRRSKHLTRQARVEARAAPRQCSEPAPLLPPPLPAPPLRKHHSYPQLAAMMRRQQQQVGSLLIRAVTVVDRRGGSGGGSGGAGASSAEGPTPRASHTPAVRSGPPLSCNFCWNTVDESGRILRRKTQYHCPECRTNLCIVPCFHEYHDAETELASVR